MIAVGIDPDTTTTGVAVVELVGNRMIVRGVALVRAKGRKVQDRLVGMASELAYVFRDGIRLDLQDVEPDAVTMDMAVALIATVGHYTMTLAFQCAPMTVTQPVTFLQLVWAATLGAVAFGEIERHGLLQLADATVDTAGDGFLGALKEFSGFIEGSRHV